MKKIYIKSTTLIFALLWSFGVIAADQKIVGGVKAANGAWPSTVALLSVADVNDIESGENSSTTTNDANFQAQRCGGSLISSTWVLTAAHCVVSLENGEVYLPSDIYALVGTSSLSTGGERKQVKRIIVHPDYSHLSDDVDIALLELKTATSVSTIKVSNVDAATGSLAYVVGWGTLSESPETYPTDLYEVELPIVSRDVCTAVYGDDFTENMFCAGIEQGGKDSCKGDSGGPIMTKTDGSYTQIGIVSWGFGCARQGIYGNYTRLSQYKSWIDTFVKTKSKGGGSFSILLALPLLGLLRRKMKMKKVL